MSPYYGPHGCNLVDNSVTFETCLELILVREGLNILIADIGAGKSATVSEHGVCERGGLNTLLADTDAVNSVTLFEHVHTHIDP